MMLLNVVISTFLVSSVVSEYAITSSEEDMDAVIDMLMQNEVTEYKDTGEGSVEVSGDSEDQPVLDDGVWKCGDCDDIDESKLLYTESYDVENNYDDDDNDGYVNLQFGMAIENMRCITITTDGSEFVEMKRVTGTCAGDSVTLQVAGASRYDARVYG